MSDTRRNPPDSSPRIKIARPKRFPTPVVSGPPAAETGATLCAKLEELIASMTGFVDVRAWTCAQEDPQRAEVLVGVLAAALFQLRTAGAVCVCSECVKCLLTDYVDELTSDALRDALGIAKALTGAWADPDAWSFARSWTQEPALAERSLRDEVAGLLRERGMPRR